MTRSLVLGICACALFGALGCSGDDDGGGSGSTAGSGSGGSGSGSGLPGSGSSGSGSGSGLPGSGSSGAGGSGSGTGSGGTGSGGTGAGGIGSDPILVDGGLITPSGDLLLCGGEACACADGIDNDNDGTEDGFDIECTGPFDDDEGSFATGISGDNMDPYWQDCFFDGNSGGGDDHCRYHTECLTGDRAQDDPSCVVSQTCQDFCAARTPPGCDCFGCCTIPTDDGPVDVITNAGCDSSDIASCTTCTKSELCNNECGECELCTGVTVNDLPDSCFTKYPPTAGSGAGGVGGGSGSGAGGVGGGSGSGAGGVGGSGSSGSGGSGSGGTGVTEPPVYVCDGNGQLCRDQSECPPGYYCQLGCCKIVAPE